MRRLYLFTLALIAALASCTVEPTSEVSSMNNQIIIRAIAEESDDNHDTKTVLLTDGSVWWRPGDAISVFYDEGDYGGYEFKATITEAAPESGFKGSYAPTEKPSYYWAVYPYNGTTSCDGSSVTISLPPVQESDADTFGYGQFPLLAQSPGSTMRFYHVCGGIRFVVATEGIRTVTIRNLDGGMISGNAKVAFNDDGVPEISSLTDGKDVINVKPSSGDFFVPGTSYYIVIPPTTFSKGAEITYMKDWEVATYTSESFTIERGSFRMLLNRDSGLTFSMPTTTYLQNYPMPLTATCSYSFDESSDFGSTGTYIAVGNLNIIPVDWAGRDFSKCSYWDNDSQPELYFETKNGTWKTAPDFDSNDELTVGADNGGFVRPLSLVFTVKATATCPNRSEQSSSSGWITFRDNGTLISSFNIYIPVKLVYSWGSVIESEKIHVQ